MGKIKVSKEVAAALDSALKVVDKEEFFEDHSNKPQWTLDIYMPLNQISNWKMANILINGYEVEETPEERVQSLYNSCIINRDIFKSGSNYYISWDSQAKGIVNCLNRLEIKIKGING